MPTISAPTKARGAGPVAMLFVARLNLEAKRARAIQTATAPQSCVHLPVLNSIFRGPFDDDPMAMTKPVPFLTPSVVKKGTV